MSWAILIPICFKFSHHEFVIDLIAVIIYSVLHKCWQIEQQMHFY